jgi:hypothetical protein
MGRNRPEFASGTYDFIAAGTAMNDALAANSEKSSKLPGEGVVYCVIGVKT